MSDEQSDAPSTGRRFIDLEVVRRCAAAGMSRRATARQIGFSYSTVHRAEKRHGIEFFADFSEMAFARMQGRIFWEQNDVELVRRFHAGESFGEIGAALGVSKNAAIGRANRLNLLGLTAPPPRHRLEFPPPKCCLYAIGHLTDAGFRWCGEPALPGQSWCDFHRRKVYRPAPEMPGTA